MGNRLLDTQDSDHLRALENVNATVLRIWSRPLHRYFTDHTEAHSERIIDLLNGLTASMMLTDKCLSSTEAFVLLVATYLHDIGMQNERFAEGDLDEIRAHHHEQTAEMIYRALEAPQHAFAIPLGDDPALVEAIALVAAGHRKMDLTTAEYDDLPVGGETLRLRLLAALLRFADELDIDYRRVNLEHMKLLDLPLDSQLHWWKCYYVNAVSIVDEYIRVAYRFPKTRPDYEHLIIPLVESEIRARHAVLEPIFRTNAVKVALGPPQVRLMRLVRLLPPKVEALAQQKLKVHPSDYVPSDETDIFAPVQVTILIEREFDGFDSIERENLVSALAQVANISPAQIRILRVSPGSVLVTLEMPKEVAETLLSMYLKTDPILESLGIAKVQLQLGSDLSVIPGQDVEMANEGKPGLIKVLFLSANPLDTSRLRLDQESRAIDEALRRSEFRDRFDIEQHWAVRVSDMQELLLRHKPDIVHFSGHGSTLSEIVLEDASGNSRPVSVRALSRLFSVLKDNIRCVVLNACYSEKQAQAIAQSIDCVIGMSKAIGDDAAISFAAAFYQALGFGRDVRTAFELGCVQIDLEGLDEQDVPKLLAEKTSPDEIVLIK